MFVRSNLARCAALVVVGALGLAGCRGGGSEAELTSSARDFIEKRDHRAAAIQLKNALAQNPDNVEARVLLGQALIVGNDPTAALVELRKAQDLKAADDLVLPHLARAMLMVGDDAKIIEQFASVKLKDATAGADLLTSVATAHAVRGDVAKAKEVAASALEVKPDFVPALVMQAQLIAAEGKVDEALALTDKALAVQPKDERAGVLKGDLLWRGKKDVAKAAESYRKVLEHNSESIGAHTSLIAMLAQDGKAEESRAQFATLKKVLPNHPETLFYEAQVAFADQNYKLARELTDRLLKAMPENVRVLELAGAAEYRMGQFLAAEAFLGKAIKNNPGQTMSRQLLAQTYLRGGQPSKALDILAPITQGPKPDGVSLSLAGEAHLQLGESQKADQAFQLATKAEPDNTRVRTAVAVSQLNRGNPAAMAELESIAQGDKSPRADLALVSAKLRQGDFEGSLKAADALERKLPDRAMPLGVRGQVLLHKRDNAGARKAFMAALAKEPGYFPAVASLSALDLAEGKTDDARKRFQDYSKANPGNHQAWLAQAELAARTGAAPSEVTRLTREAVKVNPAEPNARMVLIEQLISSGDAKGAVVAAQEAVGAMPNNMDIAESLGRAQIAAGDGQQAVSTFKKLTGLQAINPRLQIRLAEAMILARDNAGAEAALKRALEAQPGYLPAQRGLVMLATIDKRPQDAVNQARELQKLRPKEAVGFLLEAEAEVSRKNFDAAVPAFRAALQRGKSTDIAMKLHNALLVGGKRTEADRWASEWLKENARDAGFRFYLGDMSMARGENVAAEALYRSVLDIQPANALAMNNIAWLMVKQNKPGALALAEKAVSLLADRAPLLDTLATAQAAEGQVAKAIETQKRAVELEPENPSLRLALARHYLRAGDKAFARAELETLSRLGDKFAAQSEVSSLLKSL
jgi:putative PEP-CTERM system TPR-repeat lipoprotein